jgi:phosphonoacetate hydrolase
MPSFTNPNNLSIVTGSPPSVHGIAGNYFLDLETGQELMMNDAGWLRAPTILEGLERTGCKIAVITAKDKLRSLLGHGLRNSICFSAERAGDADLTAWGLGSITDMVGMPVPNVYSAELSTFVLAAGLEIFRHVGPSIMYLSTTDYVQHKFAPGTEEANAFFAAIDSSLSALDRLGAVIGITADHGMKPKTDSNGNPNAVFLQEILDELFGKGSSTVTLPITDPYVAHHGSLGSFANIYVWDANNLQPTMSKLTLIPQVMTVLTRAEAVSRFELPEDRIGDLVVVAHENAVLGKRREDHDMSLLEVPLRSHGGLSEQEVPLLVNRQLENIHPARRLRNFDVFDLVLNSIGRRPLQFTPGEGKCC